MTSAQTASDISGKLRDAARETKAHLREAAETAGDGVKIGGDGGQRGAPARQRRGRQVQ